MCLLVGANHTTESHGWLAVVMVVMMQTALMSTSKVSDGASYVNAPRNPIGRGTTDRTSPTGQVTSSSGLRNDRDVLQIPDQCFPGTAFEQLADGPCEHLGDGIGRLGAKGDRDHASALRRTDTDD